MRIVLMKKLLGLALCVCAVLVLSLGSTGCGEKKKDGKDTKKTEGGDAKADVKVKEPKDKEEVTLKKEGDTEIAVKLDGKAPEELKLTVKGDKLKGDATIKKDEDSGKVKVTAEKGCEAKDFTIEIAETPKTKAATISLKVKKIE